MCSGTLGTYLDNDRNVNMGQGFTYKIVLKFGTSWY